MKIAQICALINEAVQRTNAITGANARTLEKEQLESLLEAYRKLKAEAEGWRDGDIEGEADPVQRCRWTIDMFIKMVVEPTIKAFTKKLEQLERMRQYAQMRPVAVVTCTQQQPGSETPPEPNKELLRKILITWRDLAQKTTLRKEQAYSKLDGGEIWKNHHTLMLKLGSPNYPFATMPTFRQRSVHNLQRLRDALGTLSTEERHFIEQFHALPFMLVHNTNQIALIEQSDQSLSASMVQQMFPDANINCNGKDEVHLANTDFVFFRYSLQDEWVASRFGICTMLFQPAQIGFYEQGWVSMHDMLLPIPTGSSAMQRFRFNGVKVGEGELFRKSFDENTPLTDDERCLEQYMADHSIEHDYQLPNLEDHILHYYPKTRKWALVHVVDQVFHGPQILDGIALCLLQEMRNMGPEAMELLFKACKPPKSTAKSSQQRKGANRSKTVSTSSSGPAPHEVFLKNLLHNFFRVEAKMPAYIELGGLLNVKTFHPTYELIEAHVLSDEQVRKRKKDPETTTTTQTL